MATPEYPKTKVNKLGRLANRGIYDYATIHSIVNQCPVLHVSFTDPEHPFPVVLPMLGCTGNFGDQDAGTSPLTCPTDANTIEQDVYIHGYVSGRIFRSGKNAEGDGLPITIAATFLDGLVLSLTPFHNSCNYRSAVVYGYASLVEDRAEALYAMKKITDNLLPERWDKSRVPPTEAELKSTSILKVKVQSASAKVRVGGPSEDRADLKNKELEGKTWTGVVPYWGVWGEPVDGKENGCKEVEGYIEQWRQRETARARGYAFEAVKK
ncbi:5-nitroimidazole antibiotic resistance protein [Setomelanomma holmii]|uniref:5-nitroimidazole antibiotic resistance protein n=1 Tax=Setomelanomma holmii TaxID=210430 RepID=A0A9P4LKQ4_9PLEO|nr:5-nitroimidazole antibiotic resistance protein [Setomelanomma holmii]